MLLYKEIEDPLGQEVWQDILVIKDPLEVKAQLET